MPENPILCAIDTPDAAMARGLVGAIAGAVGGVKLGLEFFVANGPGGVRETAQGLPLFLDLKLHDIPNTVARALRAACGRDFLLVVPGIRPAGAATGDQKRVMGPRISIAAGADYLVIGRPITAAPDPAAAARAILAEIG
jgi:orotidine-5'-phosphate decarboxylase